MWPRARDITIQKRLANDSNLVVTATAAGINHLSGELVEPQRYHQALCLRAILLQRSAELILVVVVVIGVFVTFQLR